MRIACLAAALAGCVPFQIDASQADGGGSMPDLSSPSLVDGGSMSLDASQGRARDATRDVESLLDGEFIREPSDAMADVQVTADADSEGGTDATAPDPPNTEVFKQDESGGATAAGRIITSDFALDCGSQCSLAAPAGEPLTLYALPAAGYAFDSWLSGCTGTDPSCTIVPTDTTSTRVVAKFVPANLIFVTSARANPSDLVASGTPLTAPGASDAERLVAGADAHCVSLATKLGRPNATWRAWLSRRSGDAIDRFVGRRGWIRVDGAPVFDALSTVTDSFGYAQLLALYPPLLSENAAATTSMSVITGSTGAGRFAGWGGNCYERDPSPYDYQVAAGDPLGGSGAFSFGGWYQSCEGSFNLYCLQADYDTPIRMPSLPGRRMFLSAGPAPLTGLAGFDATCKADATVAGLNGSYRAFAADASTSIGQRFSLRHQRVIRPDGVIVADTDDDLMAGRLRAPIERRANGQFKDGVGAWTGSLGTAAVGTSTCSNWTDTNATGTYADSRKVDGLGDRYFTGMTTSCLSAFSVFCLEE